MLPLKDYRSNAALFVVLSILIGLVAPFTFGANGRNGRVRPDSHTSNVSTRSAYEHSNSDVNASQSDLIRQLSIGANDVVYSPVTKMLYASIPSAAGANGNSIATIDPTTASLISTKFIGSEPNRLALSDDGTTLYVSLDGSGMVRRFDVSNQTPGAQFAVGQDSFFGLYSVTDLAVAPGNPNLVAVSRSYRGVSPPEAGVAIFDNGVQRPNTGPGHSVGSDFLSFSASASKLYGTGYGSGLTTMTIDNAGVTIAKTSALSNGWRLKFDSGIVFSGNGQVINPDTDALLGSFSGVTSTGRTAFVSDASVGRAYYLVSDQYYGNARTLKVFDINSFLQVGSLSIADAPGDITNMIRWGANGLAFRTSTGQVFVIQTSLIPSVDPIPTPSPTPTVTPTPSPTPFDAYIRQISLPTNDLIYSKSTELIYASVPGRAGLNGNSIITVDPTTATLGNPVFVGSDPGKLELSDDNHSLYAILDGAASIRRFDVTTQTPGLEFSVGSDTFNGPRFASNLAIMPGMPGTVAVGYDSGIAIYDDGVRRPQTDNVLGLTGSLQFGSQSTLYEGNGAIRTLAVGASGLSAVGSTMTGSSGPIVYSNGLVYMSGGAVVDPVTSTIKGTFAGLGYNAVMAVDAEKGRVYFLSNPSNWVLRAFDINTFLPIGSVNIQGMNGDPTSLVRWGSNGLAFRTAGDKVFLIQSSLVDSSVSVPSPTPTPSPVPSPSPAYIPTYVKLMDLQANDLVYNALDQEIYASVASTSGSNGNSIARVNPQTGNIDGTVFIGSEPDKLALSDDGHVLYANLDGAQAVRRYDIPAQTPGIQFSTGVLQPSDMEVIPGSSQTLAVPLADSGVAIFDNGVKRTNTGIGNLFSVSQIEFNGPATIYGTDYSNLMKFSVDALGTNAVSTTRNMNLGSVIKFSNGLLYGSFGRVVDPEAKKLVGSIKSSNFLSNAFVVDQALGRIFFVSNPYSSIVLSAFDLHTLVPLGTVTLASGVNGQPTSLVRWGSNGLAFRVSTGYGPPGPSNISRMYLVQSKLVSSVGSVPAGVQFAANSYFGYEGSSNVTVTVNRTGDVTASSTVDYATTDGTAKAGSDYTAVSGTLTFAAGEFTKTISLPILTDNLYEGTNETFGINLSNASSGTLLNSPSTAIVTISDSQSKPSIYANATNVIEGHSGVTNAAIKVTLSNATYQPVTVSYNTSDGTAHAGTDYTATSGTLTFDPGVTSMTINVPITGDLLDEGDETFFVNLSNGTNVSYISTPSTMTIVNDDGAPKMQFSTYDYEASEGNGSATITVERFGRLTDTVTVDYQTGDATALQTKDYTTTAGTLTFVPGEASKTFEVPITDDGYVESPEDIQLYLSNAKGNGVSLAYPFAVLTITDNDTVPSPDNPIDNAQVFVKQHYADFLSRVPDSDGFNYWTAQLTQCGSDVTCLRNKRTDVSNAFFYELEFQQTGSYVFRLYRAAYGNTQPIFNPLTDPNYPNEGRKLPSYAVFASDRARVSGGSNLADSQLNLANAFVQRSQFLARYPATLSTEQFVDAILNTVKTDLGVDLTSQRQALLDLAGSGGRGAVLYRLADDNLLSNPINNRTLIDSEYDRAFVFTQYSGYLRRNADIGGFRFWLGQVDNAPLRDVQRQHAMVCSFLTSAEYQLRFSSTITHSNAECQ